MSEGVEVHDICRLEVSSVNTGWMEGVVQGT